MKTFRTIAASSLLACAGAASAASFSFAASGFDGGGGLRGTFAGSDLNGNGLISTADPGAEVTAFSLHFDGDAAVPSFSAGSADLIGMSWRPAGGAAWGDGVNEGLMVGVSGRMLAGGTAAFGEPGLGVVDETSGAASVTRLVLQVTPVPEPGSTALLGFGLVALAAGAARRRRH